MELTDKQKVEVEQLRKDAKSAGKKIQIKYAILLILSMVITVALNDMFVKNVVFLFIVSFLNGMMIGNLQQRELKEKELPFREKAQEILKNP